MTAVQGSSRLTPTIRARRADLAAEAVEKAELLGVATLHEAYGRRGLMQDITPLDRALTLAGPAVTALCHAGDNLMIHAAIDRCQPGDVLVVSTLSPSSHGMFGDLLATLCQARGLAGLVIDAGVRDIRIIGEMGFPVWSRHISAAGTTKQTAGWVNVPVVCGGITVAPGDLVAADADGVIVIAADDVAATVPAAEQRERNEEATRARYLTGRGKDVSELLAAAGVLIETS